VRVFNNRVKTLVLYRLTAGALDGTPTSVLACWHRGLQAVRDPKGAEASLRRKSQFFRDGETERKEGGGCAASGKHCSGNENFASCEYRPNPDTHPARLKLSVTYIGCRFGISGAYAKSAKPLHSFSSPGSGGRGPPKTGIGDRRQDQSFKILLYRAGSGVFSHPCADK